jgi:hypothetical protein
MSDKEQLHFKVGLSGTSSIKQPEFRIMLNDHEVLHTSLSNPNNETEFFEFDTEVAEGSNSLIIELLNKNSTDTVRDQTGNIVSDMLLNIDMIEIDDIDIGTLKWTLSDYRPVYPAEYVAGQKLEESVRNCVNLGWNGRWILPFQSPFYIWLLENT